jgi:predicted ATP-binding protein involved in virulence
MRAAELVTIEDVMRIDQLTVQNFKGFAEREFEFPRRLDTPHDEQGSFHLLIGENGSGKTSTLDALAVAMGIWLVIPRDSILRNSRRNILPSEVLLEPRQEGDRVQFRECKPVVVRAVGNLAGRADITWTRQVREGDIRTTNTESQEALDIIREVFRRDQAGERVVCPVLAYYGAGRAWLASRDRVPQESPSNGPARRWAAFYDCLNERIRFSDLRQWFKRELIAAGNRGGRMRPGFEAVRRAILNCVPEANTVWFDGDREQIVLSIAGEAQPLANLSAGQRMMLALAADLAIRAVTQNAHLLPPEELGPEDTPLPRVLAQTPGVVLIDELDVHLHPKWQRHVAADLKRTFPNMQFVCTSHSPQVIGELARDEIMDLRAEGTGPPAVAYGADSNWILDHVMDASSRAAPARQIIREAEDALDEADFPKARLALDRLRRMLGGEDGELVRLESSLYTLEALAGANDQ